MLRQGWLSLCVGTVYDDSDSFWGSLLPVGQAIWNRRYECYLIKVGMLRHSGVRA